jgi:hypothetical protein
MEHSLSQFNRDFYLDSSSISKELHSELQDTSHSCNQHKEEFEAIRNIPMELSISLLVELRAFEQSMDKISDVYSNDSVTLSVSKSTSLQSVTSPLQRRLFQKQLKHEDTDDEFYSCDDDDEEEEEEVVTVEEGARVHPMVLEYSDSIVEEKEDSGNKESTS